MQSGKIMKSQLSSYSSAAKEALNLARLFGPDGWRPDDAYLTSSSRTITSLTNLQAVLALPIYYEVTFAKMQKITYFIIQDSLNVNGDYDQSFYIAYNDSQMRMVKGSTALVITTFFMLYQYSYTIHFQLMFQRKNE